MHYDQIRDWGIALGPFSELPLLGPVTHLGGSPPGPAAYWVLWCIRVTVGPWFDNLPHAGGIGQALLHSAADVLLFLGIRHRTGSVPLAAAVVLLVASAPYDLALSATVWPPMLAVTTAKVASAMVLLGWGERQWWRAAATAAVAWAGVQSHVPGTFAAAAVLLYLVVQPLMAWQWRAHAGPRARRRLCRDDHADSMGAVLDAPAARHARHARRRQSAEHRHGRAGARGSSRARGSSGARFHLFMETPGTLPIWDGSSPSARSS